MVKLVDIVHVFADRIVDVLAQHDLPIDRVVQVELALSTSHQIPVEVLLQVDEAFTLEMDVGLTGQVSKHASIAFSLHILRFLIIAACKRVLQDRSEVQLFVHPFGRSLGESPLHSLALREPRLHLLYVAELQLADVSNQLEVLVEERHVALGKLLPGG